MSSYKARKAYSLLERLPSDEKSELSEALRNVKKAGFGSPKLGEIYSILRESLYPKERRALGKLLYVPQVVLKNHKSHRIEPTEVKRESLPASNAPLKTKPSISALSYSANADECEGMAFEKGTYRGIKIVDVGGQGCYIDLLDAQGEGDGTATFFNKGYAALNFFWMNPGMTVKEFEALLDKSILHSDKEGIKASYLEVFERDRGLFDSDTNKITPECEKMLKCSDKILFDSAISKSKSMGEHLVSLGGIGRLRVPPLKYMRIKSEDF